MGLELRTSRIQRSGDSSMATLVGHDTILRIETILNSSLNFALGGGHWLFSRPSRFRPVDRTRDTQLIGGWVSPTADADVLEKMINSSPF
jgi:hypothetical protein